MRESFVLRDAVVKPGTRAAIDLPITDLSTHTPISMPVQVVHGRAPGPSLFVCAALHGDEINGVEIIRRLMRLSALKRLRGTLIAEPIVNVPGFLSLSRYLPDRRDLNRSFPGSERGSMAGRLASLFLEEIVGRATHGIDLHTGAIHRDNFPQIRGDFGDPYGENEIMVHSMSDGIVIGRTNLPLVHEGDALFHIARHEGTQVVARSLDAFEPESDYESGLTAELADEPSIV